MKGSMLILDDDEVDELTMVVGKSGAPRPIARRLGSEFDEVAPARALAPHERPTTGRRPLVNGDSPNAYKILGQAGRSMVATSAWMMMFGPKEVGGAKWMTLEKELVSPIDSSGLTQLAEQTKRLLEAMGFECAAMPSKVALQIWELGDASAELTRWKCELKDSFGVRSSTTVRKLDGVDPSTVPLPSTPKKSPAGTGFQTPATKGDDTDDEDDDDDYAGRDYADPCGDWAAQVRRSYHHEDDDGAQRIKLAHHISLSKLAKFNGTRNRSERSLRWLKKFFYAMEGTNTPQDRWCEPFQLCMEGVSSTPEEDSVEMVAVVRGVHGLLLLAIRPVRRRSIMYETGGPAGARHVKRFLDTCEDDALVRQLIRQRFDNFAKVEAVINDMIASDRRRKDRGNSSRKPSREGGRRNDSGRRDDRRADREDRRGDGRGRREDRYNRQVTVAEASVDELYAAWQSRLAITPRRRAVLDSGSDYSDRPCKSECKSDGGYVDTAEAGRGNIGGRADSQNRPHGFMGDGRRDEARRPRWGD
ncbi:unnamed protein product [Phytophthora fragariaefolia]|uniref:Unnamed protein product n=1 Tax=Phytophthora fragariaefolia TaxID=1490495 RepID=A0A9W6Y841_9STRA|nr:unnamed protein product [Phytophthora fragariaefolia]